MMRNLRQKSLQKTFLCKAAIYSLIVFKTGVANLQSDLTSFRPIFITC